MRREACVRWDELAIATTRRANQFMFFQAPDIHTVEAAAFFTVLGRGFRAGIGRETSAD
jgi:hypothetical protein